MTAGRRRKVYCQSWKDKVTVLSPKFILLAYDQYVLIVANLILSSMLLLDICCTRQRKKCLPIPSEANTGYKLPNRARRYTTKIMFSS